jgi:hypothetical protein
VEIRVIDAQGVDRDPVETVLVLADRSIPTRPDLVENGPHLCDRTGGAEVGAWEISEIPGHPRSEIEGLHHGDERSGRLPDGRTTAPTGGRIGKDGEVPPDRSELASIAELLDHLTDRITAMAEGVYAAKEEGAAAELFAIERTLRGASRKLARLLTAHR